MSKLTDFTITRKEKDEFYGFHRIPPSQTIYRKVTKVAGNESVFEYNLGVAYSISSASFVDSVSLTGNGEDPNGNSNLQGIVFNTDGTKMFVTDLTNAKVNEYALSSAFDVSSLSYTQSFSVANQDLQPTGLTFNTSGTKMFVVGSGGLYEKGIDPNNINEYTLSSAFDISTATYSQRLSINAQDTNPKSIFFNKVARGALVPGQLMFIVGDDGDDVNEYELSSAFDVSTATFIDSYSVTAQDTSPWGLEFDDNGDRIYVVGGQDNAIYTYPLVTPSDISTTQATTDNFTLAQTSIVPKGFRFNNDGTKMFVIGNHGQFQIDDGDDETPYTHLTRSKNTLKFYEGNTYVFDLSDTSMVGYDFKFSSTSDGTHAGGTEYTTNVTTSGTPGNLGAKVTIVVPSETPSPNPGSSIGELYYYDSTHNNMGGKIYSPEWKGELQITYTNGTDDIDTRYRTKNQEDIFEDSLLWKAGLNWSIVNGNLIVGL